jgi:hypothetical protein
VACNVPCPSLARCYSHDTERIVLREGLKSELKSLLGKVPYRCNGCVKIFFAKRRAVKATADKKER